MKKWLLAWIVFTAYLIVNMTVMQSAEQPHLVSALLLGFFFFLIFGIRGVYFAMTAVGSIVLLAVLAHFVRHQDYHGINYAETLFYLLLDIITIMGGGGCAHWFSRLSRFVQPK